MNRKQNSLMRFSRTERLAQLSEQEIVIEKKKKEIQAKLEAQKKKETEEALKKLEFSKEIKNNKPGFSNKPRSVNESKKTNNQVKPVEEVKESLTNAFSNDGTFLDQFKKLSQSGLSSHYDMQTPAPAIKREIDLKNFKDPDEETFSKGENDIDRNDAVSLKKNQKALRHSNQLSQVRDASDSAVQPQTTPPMIFQFSQHQGVSELSAGDSSKSKIPLLSNLRDQIQGAELSSELSSSKIKLNSSQFNYPDTKQSMPSVQGPEFCEKSNSKEFPVDELSSSLVSGPSIQPSVTSQSNIGPSVTSNELPKVRSESISMTLKVNTVKKLEAIPNPLEADQTILSSVKKNQFTFPVKENLKNTSLNTSKKFSSTARVENISSHEDSSRISSAFYNEDHDHDDDEDDDNEDKDEGGGRLYRKYQHWAGLVARCGDEFEDSLRSRNENDPDLRFLSNKNSKEYLSYRKLVLKYRMSLKSSEEKPSEKSQKLNLPKAYSEQSMENIPCNDKDLSIMKTSDEDSYKVKDYLQSEKISDNQQEANEILVNENQNNDECNSASHSTFKEHCFSNPQKEKLPEETSSKNLKIESNVEQCERLKTEERRKRKRKSRWGDAVPTTSTSRVEANLDLQPLGKLAAPKSTLLSQLTRSDPGLIQYARQTFGSTNLSEEDWKKAEDHYKINLLYQDMIKKRAEVEKLERQGKFKYEYDSDEDTEGGTWEHKLRQQEMQATQLWAEELTRQAAGKHHIGDFLPPEELERFMEKYNAVKEGREPDLSDYKEYKLKEDNVGYRLLQKMGWNEGQGLGQDGSGITNPVNKATTRHENQGLGVERPDGLEPGDDEYDAYRKRMMLAYRFRPNPLNNPRRPYY